MAKFWVRDQAGVARLIGGAVFNVKDYGAVGDGVVDDTNAIRAALAAIPSSGGIVEFPPGTYLVSSTIDVPDGVTFRGVTRAFCILKTTSATAAIFNIIGGYTSIENLQFSCSTTRTAGVHGYIDVSGAVATIRANIFNAAIEAVRVSNAASGFIGEYNEIHLISLGVGFRIGTTTGAGATALVLRNNLVTGAGFSCAAVLAAGDLILSANQFLGSSNNLYVAPDAGQEVDSIKSIGNFYDQGGSSSIAITPTSTGSVKRCEFIGDWASGAATQNVVVAPAATGVIDSITFTDLECYGITTNNGLVCSAGSGTINFIGITGGSFGGNVTAISLTDVSRGHITGAMIGAVGGLAANTTGISLGGATDKIAIVGNAVTGNSTDYTNTASGTNIKVRGNIGINDTSIQAANFINTTAPSTLWGIDFTSGGSISLANNATYDLAAGAGLISIVENSGAASGLVWAAFGGTTILVNSPAGVLTTTAGTAGKINVYYNGAGAYRIENKLGATSTIFVGTMRGRPTA